MIPEKLNLSFTDVKIQNHHKFIITAKVTDYFSFTATEYFKEKLVSCGQLLEVWEEHFPQYSWLRKLHLASIDGAPVHATSNGYYFLQNNRNDKQIKLLSEHLRIDEFAVLPIIDAYNAGLIPTEEIFNDRIIKPLLPRWKQEAVIAIEFFKLKQIKKD